MYFSDGDDDRGGGGAVRFTFAREANIDLDMLESCTTMSGGWIKVKKVVLK